MGLGQSGHFEAFLGSWRNADDSGCICELSFKDLMIDLYHLFVKIRGEESGVRFKNSGSGLTMAGVGWFGGGGSLYVVLRYPFKQKSFPRSLNGCRAS